MKTKDEIIKKAMEEYKKCNEALINMPSGSIGRSEVSDYINRQENAKIVLASYFECKSHEVHRFMSFTE